MSLFFFFFFLCWVFECKFVAVQELFEDWVLVLVNYEKGISQSLCFFASLAPSSSCSSPSCKLYI